MRKKIVAGNWKMNLNLDEGRTLTEAILEGLPVMDGNHIVVLAPPFIHLPVLSHKLEGQVSVFLGAQNCHQENSGAYTGEISAAMLQSCGVKYVIIGHSERREYFHETDALLAAKTNSVLIQGMKVIFCCGEALEVRDAGTQNEHIKAQLENGLFHLSPEQLENVVIAYEPIWAIGTGRTASAEQAQDMHAHIRKLLTDKYGSNTADNMSILYGGSCKPSNAAELFACPDVDGGLIGGAALKAEDFLGIITTITEA